MATYRFLTGTWHKIDLPDDKVDQEGYSPEELYDSFWNDELPEDVEVDEIDVSHIWESDLK